MRTSFFYPFVIALLFMIVVENSATQNFKGGVIKYQQTTKYNFKTIFGEFDDPKANEWVASLPTEKMSVTVLYFTEEKALYEEDTTEKEALNLKLQEAQEKASYFKPPQPELEKVFYDFGKNEITQQVMFMTRNFLISDSIESQGWKLTNNLVKILDYTCLGAELKKGDDTVTAWFTSEIPVSTGPGEFFGLPGLILAIEINGETAFIATSIELTPPEESVLSKPDRGRKVTQEEFNKIIEEKTKEFKDITNKK